MLTFVRLNTILLLILSAASSIHAQITITGHVKDLAGRAISGASVVFSDQKTGTVSDSAGYYQLAVPTTGTVTFSAKGFLSQQLTITEQQVKPIIILKYDILGLEAVVITGAAAEKTKKENGTAISMITEDQLRNTASPSLSGMLNGRIMGGFVTQNSGDPGGGYTLRLRGVSSLFSSSEPLYMIDGMIIDNSSPAVINLNGTTRSSNNRLSDINPADIERIEIVNGPAAAAIYGSRAANGIVQIFTKKGARGKPSVSFFTSVNHNSLRKKVHMNNYPYRFGRNPSPRLETISDKNTLIANYRTDPLPIPQGPTANNGSFEKRLELEKYDVTRYDYQDDIFQQGWGTENNVSVSGAGEKSSYYFGAGYLFNEGIIRNTSFSRYNFRMSMEHELASWARMTAGLNYGNTATTDMPSVANFYTPTSSLNFTDNVWNIHERGSDGELLPTELGRINPLSMIEKYRLKTNTGRFIGNMSVDLNPMKGLQIHGLLGLDTYNTAGDSYMGRLNYPGIDHANYPDGYVSTAMLNYSQWTTDLNAVFKTRIGDYIQTTTSAGFSSQFISLDEFSQEGRDLLEGIEGIKAAQKLSLPLNNQSEVSIYGVFVQQSFGYASQLYISLAGRVDGSSAFGSKAQNIFYPKASLSYIVSESRFWKKLSLGNWLNTVKLRTAFGKAGNLSGLTANDRFNSFTYVNYTGGGAYITRYGNEEIKPEQKKEWEGGVDIQMLKSRFGFQFTAYRQEVEGMIIPFNIAPSNGFPQIMDNLGTMENNGIELKMDSRVIDSKKLKWDLSFLYSHYRNKLTSLYRNARFIAFDLNQSQGAMVGQPMNVYIGTYYARNTDGSLLLKDVNGFMLPQAERGNAATGTPGRDQHGQPVGELLTKILGDPNPDYQAAFHSSLRYNNWGFRIMFDRTSGFERWNVGRIQRNNNGNGIEAEMELRGKLTRGYVAATGNFLGDPINENYVQDGSFTKLRELAISYSFSFKNKANIELAVSGRNLVSWDHYDGHDPETNSAGQGLIRGIDFGALPLPRIFQLSATIKLL